MNKKEEAYKKDVLRFALFMGELMLSNGAETYRIEDTMKRICTSRGFNYINIFTSTTSIIISDARFDGITFLTTIKERGINLNKIVLFNDFSRKFVSNPDMPIEDALKELKRINNNAHSYPDFINYLFTGIGCAGFACMIGENDLISFILTTFASILAFMSYKKVLKISDIPAFSSLTASIIVSVIAVLSTEAGLIASPTSMIVGAIMPLLCGVVFIKGVRDLVTGDLISGGARITEACLISISIAVGVGLILDTWMKLGGAL